MPSLNLGRLAIEDYTNTEAQSIVAIHAILERENVQAKRHAALVYLQVEKQAVLIHYDHVISKSLRGMS